MSAPPDLLNGTGIDLDEQPPRRADWVAAVSALLRKEHAAMVVGSPMPHRRGVSLRITFVSPRHRDDVPAAQQALQTAANDLVRRMRQFEEDTTLADFERAEKAYRDGVTGMQRALEAARSAKTGVDLVVAVEKAVAAGRLLASVFFPGMLP